MMNTKHSVCVKLVYRMIFFKNLFKLVS